MAAMFKFQSVGQRKGERRPRAPPPGCFLETSPQEYPVRVTDPDVTHISCKGRVGEVLLTAAARRAEIQGSAGTEGDRTTKAISPCTRSFSVSVLSS